MKSEWNPTTIADLIEGGKLAIGDGYRAKNSELGVTGIPFARAGNIQAGFQFEGADLVPDETLEKVGNKRSESGDVVFTSKGTVGRFAWVRPETPPFVFSPQLCFWRSLDRSSLDPRFLYYWMQGPESRAQIDTLKGQTDMADYVSLSDQRKMTITLPSIDEQRRIAWVLGSLDDKIELNRRIAETLEQIVAAIFKARFVDFVGVEEFEESELGPIPKGWSIGHVRDLCATKYGYTASANTEPVGPHFLRVMDINKQPWIDWSSVPYCDISVSDKEKYGLRLGDVVVARMADPGKAGFIDQDIGAVAASYLVRLRTHDLATGFFLYGFLRSSKYQNYCVSAMGGSVQKNMNAKVITAAPLVIPPPAERDRFMTEAWPLRQRLVQTQRESSVLVKLRDALLPRLISGQLRVPKGVGSDDAAQVADELVDSASEETATEAAAPAA